MANRRRGEISAELLGKRHHFLLTLGALAEIEDELGGEDILSLVRRLAGGQMRAREVLIILHAGARAGGSDLTKADLARMVPEEGANALFELAIQLLNATFGTEGAETAQSPPPPPPGVNSPGGN